MGRLTRLFSRISLRLMLFNLLLVFLPVAGMLLLDFYEQHLERAQTQSMFRQARLIVALIQTDPQSRFEKAAPLLRQSVGDQRFRIVNADGRVLLDSGPLRDVDQEESRPDAGIEGEQQRKRQRDVQNVDRGDHRLRAGEGFQAGQMR